jgi:two-component system, NtrC family, sensor histidine kinase PilS
MRAAPHSILPGEEEWSLGMDEGLPRMWRGFMAARILVASVLLILLVFLQTTGHALHTDALILCAVYLALTIWVRWWGKPRRAASYRDPQWLYTVGADVLVFSILLYLQIGTFNFTPLFALPVLLAAVLGPLLLALGTAAAVTMVLLTEAWQLSILGAASCAHGNGFVHGGLLGQPVGHAPGQARAPGHGQCDGGAGANPGEPVGD